MQKILILTPVYKRPKILKLFLDGYERIRHQADLLIIRSLEDPYYDEIMQMLIDYNIRSIEYPNIDLGEKKNAGLSYAMKNYKFDYLMDLGSDNLINPNYIPTLFPHKDDIYHHMIGLKHLYIWDKLEDEFYFIKDYAFDHTYGAGRIYPRKILRHSFWPSGTAGMDIGLINKWKLKEDVFYVGETPYILDIKTRTNINPMDMILSRRENKAIKLSNPGNIAAIKKIFNI